MAMAKTSVPQVSQTQILVGLLIIAAFLIGYLLPKNSSLLGGSAGTAYPSASNAPTAAGPATPKPQVVKANQMFDDPSISHMSVLGNNVAKVTVVEYADLRCPFCERFFSDTEPNLIKDYVNTGKVKFAFKQFAFLGPASTLAANAVECANEQHKFWELHNYLYVNQPPETDTSMYTVDNLTQIAGSLGMNSSQFKDCLSSNKYQQNVDNDIADGKKAGVSGTPTVFIDGQPIVGAQPYASFKKIIDQELSK